MYGFWAALFVGVLLFILASYIVMSLSLKKTGLPPGLGWFRIIEAAAVLSLGFVPWELIGYVPSGVLGGLAIDRGWFRHTWQRLALGLGIAGSILPISIFVSLELFIRYFGTKAVNLLEWSSVIEPTISSIGWALGFMLVPDADVIFQSGPIRLDEGRNLVKETARVAAYTLGLTAAITIFIFVSMASVTSVVRRTIHPVVQASPVTRSTPSR
jgi:hypothetical protein